MWLTDLVDLMETGRLKSASENFPDGYRVARRKTESFSIIGNNIRTI